MQKKLKLNLNLLTLHNLAQSFLNSRLYLNQNIFYINLFCFLNKSN